MWSSTNHASRTHQFWPLLYIKTCERRSGMWGSRANCLNILEVCVMCTWQKESGNSSLILAHCCSGRATNNTAHCRQTGKQWQAADTFLEKDLSVWTVDASGTSSCVHPRVTANAFYVDIRSKRLVSTRGFEVIIISVLPENPDTTFTKTPKLLFGTTESLKTGLILTLVEMCHSLISSYNHCSSVFTRRSFQTIKHCI